MKFAILFLEIMRNDRNKFNCWFFNNFYSSMESLPMDNIEIQKKINAELAAERFWKYTEEIRQCEFYIASIIKNYDPNIHENKRNTVAFKRRIIELVLADEFNKYAAKYGNYIIVKE